jgi:DNA-binding ferritin-like protein
MPIKILLLSLSLLLTACETTYFSAMEQVGFHKRDILVDRIEAAQEAQQEGQEQFKTALEQFKEVVNFDGGKLEEVYNRLNDSYEDSVEAADTISSRIDKVDSVANALFDEWEDEIDEYSNQNFKHSSQQQLRGTKTRYSRLLRAMRKAESSIEPVLVTLKDNTLFLKHNLNARAISSLKGELSNVNQQVSSLISNMEKAIQESDKFIKELQAS